MPPTNAQHSKDQNFYEEKAVYKMMYKFTDDRMIGRFVRMMRL